MSSNVSPVSSAPISSFTGRNREDAHTNTLSACYCLCAKTTLNA